MKRISCLAIITLLFSITANAQLGMSWVKVKASDKYQRTAIAGVGVTIEGVEDDFVTGVISDMRLPILKDKFEVMVSFPQSLGVLDYPAEDSNFHNYDELNEKLVGLATNNPDIVELKSIGRSIEDRDINAVRISFPLENASEKPGVIFMGGHHAREHLSVEMPLMLAEYLVAQYRAGNQRIVNLVNNRDIHIIPLVNPDGAEHDISGGRYKTWRKNRRNNGDGTIGVDLNRNYGYQWGTGSGRGSGSNNTSEDDYRGTAPFSEPETQAIKTYVEAHRNLTILLSYHTFSELILYPWGHKYDSIGDNRAFEVHKTMARRMSEWNNYTPQQSSDLYIAAGDTTDWSFGALGLISFTFELDPKCFFFCTPAGFYPGQDKIPVVFNKNIEPALYLIEKSENPYGVLEPAHRKYGLSSALVK